MCKKEKLLYFVLILGMIISLFLVYEHFSASLDKFCSSGTSFDCGIVNKSPYANLDGIFYLFSVDFGMNVPTFDIKSINWFFDLITSNAFLGFITLVLLFVMYYNYKKNKDFLFIKNRKIIFWIKGILIFSLLYGAYLFSIQHFILKTYCILCLGLDAVIVVSLILIFTIKPNNKVSKI